MTITLDDVDLADLDTFVAGVPHEMFDTLRSEAPVWFHPASNGVEGFWCIVKHHDLMGLSRDYGHASSALGGITLHDMSETDLEMQRMMMLQMDPPKHTKLRLLVNKGFTPRMVGRLDQHIREVARAIVDEVAERGECDFVVDVAAELPLQVIAEMMGVPDEDRHKIFDWSNRMIGSDDPEYSVTREEAIGAGDRDVHVRHRARGGEARRTSATTSSARCCRPRSRARCSPTLEFNLFFQLLAVAGNETTRNLISHGMHFLIEHPEQQAKLRRRPLAAPERDRGDAALRVTGDVHAAAPRIRLRAAAARRSERATRSRSGTSPRTATRRSSPTRTRFDITRSPNDYVAFGGGGPHFCLGANLASSRSG